MRGASGLVGAAVATALLAGHPAPPASSAAAATASDLDALMREVLSRRDDNWKTLQQYILDEREEIELRGPGGVRLWGERRDYTWYPRDGFFVRSPLRVGGVAVSEEDRRRYEQEYLRRAQERDREERDRDERDRDGQQAVAAAPADVAALVRQTRQPQFISSAYFLRLRFEEGTYAFVGRERVDGREVLRIEHYPSNLFSSMDDDEDAGEALLRALNKVALVTLWVEPASHQIVKYTYDNVAFDFLPADWLVRVEGARASMMMGEMFPGVWLPRRVDASVSLLLAAGTVDLRYALHYQDYRQADTTIRIR